MRNSYIYEENGKIDILTFDFDKSLGVDVNTDFWTEDVNEFDLLKADKKIYSRIIEIIIENEEYNKKYYQYVKDTMQLLKDIEIDKVIDQKANITKDAIESNEKKIFTFKRYKYGVRNLKRLLLDRADMIDKIEGED